MWLFLFSFDCTFCLMNLIFFLISTRGSGKKNQKETKISELIEKRFNWVYLKTDTSNLEPSYSQVN